MPCTWHNCNRRPTPCHIRWVSGQSHRVCPIDFVAFGHATKLWELSFPCYHAQTGSDLCINSHSNAVIHLACCGFQIFCQNLVIIVWGRWHVCQTFATTLSLIMSYKRMETIIHSPIHTYKYVVSSKKCFGIVQWFSSYTYIHSDLIYFEWTLLSYDPL